MIDYLNYVFYGLCFVAGWHMESLRRRANLAERRRKCAYDFILASTSPEKFERFMAKYEAIK